MMALFPRLAFPVIAMAFGLAAAVPARADPCEGALPTRDGARFEGTVRYVGDGDSLCVGRTSRPADWIEVRLADFDAPELNAPGGRAARTTLVRLAMNRSVSCTARRGRSRRVISYDRVIATCRTGAGSLGDQLRAADVSRGQ